MRKYIATLLDCYIARLRQYNNITIQQSNNFSSGQVVLILVLVTIVGLTIGLSLISRTITDIRISSQIEQSSRAFSAAEAGVESALKAPSVGLSGTLNLTGNATASYKVEALGGTENTLSFPLTETNNSQSIWLIAHNSDGSLNEAASYPPSTSLYSPTLSFDVCWGSSSSRTAAVILSLYYLDGTTYKIAKAAYDPTPLGRTPVNNFYTADTVGGYCGGNFLYKKTITPISSAPDGFGVGATVKPLLLRIQPVYSQTALAFKPSSGNSLPVQGKVITSVGQTTTGTVRRIQVFQSYPVLPTLLDFAVFTEN